MTRSLFRVCAIALVPLLTARAQTRTAAPPATESASALAKPKRSWAPGRFILEMNGAAHRSWEYDATTGTLTQQASRAAGARPGADMGVVVSTEEAPCESTARSADACAATASRSDAVMPVPGVGIVVKNTAGTGRALGRIRMRLALTAEEVSAAYPRDGGQLVSYFPLPATLTDATYELTISLPKELIPASAAGAHEVTFALRKVPGGYDAVRASVTR